MMETREWQAKISNKNITKVRSVLAETLDPFTQRLMKSSGDKVVATMPKQMVEWLR